jgi:2-polyprenyl-3-methyl-5-hydroxy-6-metoxy-1,4-benzoquinol methylase
MQKQSIYHKRWYAEEYDVDRFGGTFGTYLHDQEVSMFLAMIDGANGKILDVGTGSGKLSLPLLRQSREVISIDLSPEMIRVSRGKSEQQELAIQPAVCDAQELCFADSSFTCALSSRVLMHLSDWKRGISELCRVAPVVILDFPPLQGFSGLESLFKRCMRPLRPETRSYKAFRIRSVIKELETHNFRIVAVRRHFFLPIAFHRWLDKPGLSVKIEAFFAKLGLPRVLGAPVTVKAIKNGSGSSGQTEKTTRPHMS